ncbi:hypothetical protein C7999DRAFT_43049 [Corynascus novoguineensis]|uniref:DRBM domain-containing protein n=1 Tax=Corynascus novoguineensis TaxID=1126955 RepID=A0AAN7CNK0_9PEZI|nr:hypothetical protein C7999DRAFT_43049 [Corynascus novoguineensis]
MANIGAIANSAVLDEPVVYRDLKAWIEQQERDPKPLSPLQQHAISILLRPPQPDIGDRDWVSLLNLYNQAHSSLSSFREESAPGQKWICRCFFRLTRDAEQMAFPNPEAGCVPDETGTLATPSFGRKKDAKQYAAKCCIEWLMKSGHMPSDGVRVEVPKNKAPPVTDASRETPPIKTKAGSAAVQAEPNVATTTSAATTTIPTTTTESTKTITATAAATTDKNDDDVPPATKRVQDLCRTLGFTVPQYKITPAAFTPTTTADPLSGTATGTGALSLQQNPQSAFFDGYADFGPDSGIKVPEGIGRVTSVYGRNNTRERVAEKVLVWLVAEERKREAEMEEFLAAQLGA